MGGQCVPDPGALWLTSLRKGRDDGTQVLSALAALYVRGSAGRLGGLRPRLFAADGRRCRLIPSSATRYWFETPAPRPAASRRRSIRPARSAPRLARPRGRRLRDHDVGHPTGLRARPRRARGRGLPRDRIPRLWRGRPAPRARGRLPSSWPGSPSRKPSSSAMTRSVRCRSSSLPRSRGALPSASSAAAPSEKSGVSTRAAGTRQALAGGPRRATTSRPSVRVAPRRSRRARSTTRSPGAGSAWAPGSGAWCRSSRARAKPSPSSRPRPSSAREAASWHPALLDACVQALAAAFPRARRVVYMPIGMRLRSRWRRPAGGALAPRPRTRGRGRGRARRRDGDESHRTGGGAARGDGVQAGRSPMRLRRASASADGSRAVDSTAWPGDRATAGLRPGGRGFLARPREPGLEGGSALRRARRAHGFAARGIAAALDQSVAAFLGGGARQPGLGWSPGRASTVDELADALGVRLGIPRAGCWAVSWKSSPNRATSRRTGRGSRPCPAVGRRASAGRGPRRGASRVRGRDHASWSDAAAGSAQSFAARSIR